MLQLERVLLSKPLQTHAVFKQSFIINQCVIFHFPNCHSVLFSHFPLSLLQLLSLNYVPFQHEFCEAEND